MFFFLLLLRTQPLYWTIICLMSQCYKIVSPFIELNKRERMKKKNSTIHSYSLCLSCASYHSAMCIWWLFFSRFFFVCVCLLVVRLSSISSGVISFCVVSFSRCLSFNCKKLNHVKQNHNTNCHVYVLYKHKPDSDELAIAKYFEWMLNLILRLFHIQNIITMETAFVGYTNWTGCLWCKRRAQF